MAVARYRVVVKGMYCDGCQIRVAKALASVGAREIVVDRPTDSATFFGPQGTDVEIYLAAIRAAGYSAFAEESPSQRDASGRGGSGVPDVLIIGSGSAAFAAAIRARELGASVTMVEAGTLGGTCVNIGCVPSKALLHHAWVQRLRVDGLVLLDAVSLVAAKDALVSELRRKKYEELVERYGWEVIRGWAEFVDGGRVSVDGKVLEARNYLIATGASPWIPPIPGLSDTPYLTSTTALEVKEVPDSIAVIGANSIGLELGQYFSFLGSQVVLLEVMPRIAPFEEPEVSSALERALVGQGIKIVTSVQITKVEPGRVSGTVAGAHMEWAVEKVLVATGRRPNTAKLGLDRAGVATDQRGAVLTGRTLRTTNPRIWAAGDVTGGPQFVYVAAYQGKIAVENMLLGASKSADLSLVPRVTFTRPQVASVGLTEAQARGAGREVDVSILPLEQVPRALVSHDTEGIVKLVADAQTGRLLGAHMVGDNAGDVIYAAPLAMKFGATVSDLTGTFAPYLTMAEGLKLAAQSMHKDVSMLSCCAG